jgi:transcriptional regulator with XRE-family HTH domain
MTGQELKDFRARLGLSQAQLASALGVAVMTVSRWERGEQRIEHPQMLQLALERLEDRTVSRHDLLVEQVAAHWETLLGADPDASPIDAWRAFAAQNGGEGLTVERSAPLGNTLRETVVLSDSALRGIVCRGIALAEARLADDSGQPIRWQDVPGSEVQRVAQELRLAGRGRS